MNNKLYKSGFLLGKFYPFHLGHAYLIEEAEKRCEKLTVLVCTLSTERMISGEKRFIAIKEWAKAYPSVTVVHVAEDVPQTPEEHPNFWGIWTRIIRENTPSDIEVVFSSETYGDEIATRLNIKHHLVDLERKTVSISGTKIRYEPYKYWHYLPDVSKQHFVFKVCLVGTESVGKSTMVQKLGQHYQAHYLPEYGRVIYDNLVKSGEDFKYDDIRTILILQRTMERASMWDAVPFSKLIMDTDALMTEFWSKKYFGYFADYEYCESTNADLYILLSAEVPWINDDTRNYSEDRDKHSVEIENLLIDYNKCYLKVGGSDYDQRFEQVKKYIDIRYHGWEQNMKGSK